MKRLFFTTLITLMIAAATAAAGTRTLTQEIPAAGLQSVVLEVGIGDVAIRAGNSPVIAVEVNLRPRRGGFFTTLAKGERQVETAAIVTNVDGSKLNLEIDADSGDRRFEEDWTITLPPDLDLDLSIGVGDVEIEGTSGDLDVETGVGDVDLEIAGGDLDIESGVGDIVIRGPAAPYGGIDAESGVGDVQIVVAGAKTQGEGFISQSAEWKGPGDDSIDAESGVGDVRVVLD